MTEIDRAVSIEVTQADRDLLIHIIAPDIDTLEQINAGQAFALEVQWIAEHRLKAARYWYRQGKDDGADAEVAQIVAWLRGASVWLNGGQCCGQKCSDGVCCAPACLWGEELKLLHSVSDAIQRGDYKPKETAGE